ncbi:dTDP-4-amino-4,6-dideoxygalactose transaminase [Henriciella sp.]|uniref:dTDP-4-amino-4,6-dideoxygalactose transaminase n=1 Tax=Henriciella sp. TaxID=1968823 RepID=UPI00262A1B5B|nr:dTDP-4-amino-4,6-dideoxygalactose transaminase [Henriciella sp.]
MDDRHIPFNWPHLTGKELEYIAESQSKGQLAGDGPFTKKCHAWLSEQTGSKTLLTHSCTAALEMAALLLDIEPGDEIIMPSYTFVSTANAFVLRGGVPVFVDVREDTLNLNETLLESAMTSRTRAIVPVHYAGVACEMDTILSIASQNGLAVVEDAAQGIMATYKGRPLGSLGDLGAFSFHETKNVISGEGGALIVNSPALEGRSEIIREKGTDRSRFFRGEVDKYSWQDVGSSFLPGEIIAAFLWAQLEKAREITDARLRCWSRYHDLLADLEAKGVLRRPCVPEDCDHNAHMYYILLDTKEARDALLAKFRQADVASVFHYVPLHSSPAGQRFGRTSGPLEITESAADRLLRLPLWFGLTEQQQDRVVGIVKAELC